MKLPDISRMADVDAARMWSQSYGMVSAVIARITPKLVALELEAKELFVLAAIDQHSYPAEIAGALCMPKPTVTVHLKRLQTAQLVQRTIDPTDLRRHCLSLTPAGRRLLTKGLTLLTEAFRDRLARLSASEQRQLAALLAKLE